MTGLLDVNVLVALAWPNHVHHAAAATWFATDRHLGWATCSVTENGFVRVSSNPAVLPNAVTPSDAIDMLRRYRSLEGHEFWIDDTSFVDASGIDTHQIATSRQVTDAHLLALAIRHEGRLVTLDRRLSRLGAGPERVLVVPV